MHFGGIANSTSCWMEDRGAGKKKSGQILRFLHDLLLLFLKPNSID